MHKNNIFWKCTKQRRTIEFEEITGKEWDRFSISEEKAIDYAHTYINKEPERMLTPQICSYEYYLAHCGDSINERYRRNSIDKEDIATAEMIAAYKKTGISLVLYRGVCKYVYELMEENAKGLIGTDLYEKGFLQCSLVKGHEYKSDINLRIFIPIGSQVVYLGNVNDEQGFYEVTVQHGAKLRIISRDSDYLNLVLLETD